MRQNSLQHLAGKGIAGGIYYARNIVTVHPIEPM
jgi:hypothetical protein